MVDLAEARDARRVRTLPYAAVWLPLAIFAATRVVGFLVLWSMSDQQIARVDSRIMHVVDPAPPDPGYLGLVTNWDGQWYQDVVENGYPRDLPRVDGEVQQNAWAFYPVYPLLVRLVMALSPLSFAAAATLVSCVAGAAMAVVLFRMLEPRVGRFNAGMAVLALGLSPAGLVLQAAYTESLALLLLVSCLLLLSGRRYGALLVPVLLLSLTRPVVLPLTALIALHGWLRWRRRHEEPFPSTERRWWAVAVVVSGASFGLWPLVCAIATGVPTGFLQTQEAWISTNADAGSWFEAVVRNPFGPAALFVGVSTAVGALVVARRGARAWGSDLRAWVPLYGAYLFFTASPVPSIIRYALLAVVPWWPVTERSAVVGRTRRTVLVAFVVAFGVVGQIAWARYFYVIGPDLARFP